jgi:hypothetical protein
MKYKIEIVTDYKIVQVRETINNEYHRYILTPDMDIFNQPDEIKKVCNENWTQEIKDKWIAKKQKELEDFNNLPINNKETN